MEIKLNKRNNLLKLLLILINILYLKSQFCHSALLTNIYSKNKLSEITDIAHRYLIIPSPSATAPPSTASNQLNINTNAGSLLSNTTIINFINSNNEEQHNQFENLPANPLPKAESLVGGNGDSPLAEAWKSAPQLSQPAPPQSLQKAKLYLQPQNNTENGGNTFSTLDFSKVPGEPAIAEGVSTEFPNPNINNLGHEITKILKKFFLHGYDKRVRPNYSGPPALVNVSFHIIGISSVDEVQMDFTTDFYFRQKWYDPRLEFKPVGSIDELCVGAEFAEKIWLPDTFFANEKVAIFHRATTDNTFIRIAHTGRVYRSIRLTVTCSCPMDLQYFPMDRQRCKIEIESYGYNTRDIDYRWERGDASVTMNDKIELPQFRILGFRMGQELQNLSSGDYVRLYCEIHFVRSMGYYLIQIYIPASLIVMISWVSFWLHRNATPARVALGVTTVLTMTTLMSSTNAALPKISYIKSIDVFLGTCFVMVFASLLEYASVGYIGKRIAMKRKRLQDLQQMQHHHQKVCVAAAASAAAAAGSQATNADGPLEGHGTGMAPRFGLPWTDGAQTLRGRLNGTGGGNKIYESSKSLQRVSRMSTSSAQVSNSGNNQDYNDNFYGPRSAKIVDNNNNNGNNGNGNNGTDNKRSPNQPNLGPNEAREPLLSSQAAAIAMANAVHHQQPGGGHGPTTEFEVSQTHDMIRICGITPSAIDKHSRVVFPICFVCFNLMYWIIYGHISQQTEYNAPPLIPFIR